MSLAGASLAISIAAASLGCRDEPREPPVEGLGASSSPASAETSKVDVAPIAARAHVCDLEGRQGDAVGVALRAGPRDAPFARLRYGSPIEPGKLTIGVLEGPQDALAVDLAASSIRLSAFADAGEVDLELRSPTMMGGFLLVERVRIVRASSSGVDVVPEPGTSIELSTRLSLHVPCGALAVGVRGERASAPGAKEPAEIVGGELLELSATADGPSVARMQPSAARGVRILTSHGRKKGVEIEADGAALVGFVDAARVRASTRRDEGLSTKRTEPPASPSEKKVCARDVGLYVDDARVGIVIAGAHIPTGEATARFTRIGAPTFDSLLSGRVPDLDLSDGAALRVETAELAACTHASE